MRQRIPSSGKKNRSVKCKYEFADIIVLMIRNLTLLSFVCALRREVIKPVHLRSYDTSAVKEVDCEIWEAGRATSAASTFFDPIKIGELGEEFIDGGTGFNNPVNEVLNEARDIWGQETDRRIQCIVSIGTGRPPSPKFGGNAYAVVMTLKDLATDTQKTAEDFAKNHKADALAGRNFRFNVSHGLEDVGLEEYKEKSTIAAATKAYLSEPEVRDLVEKCAKALRDSTCM